MRPVVVGACAPIFLALSACVGALHTTPDSVRTAALDQALEGATYSLPRLEYDVTVVRYLSSCPGKDDEGKPTQLDFSLEAKAAATYQRGETYRVDFSKIGGIARTGKFSIETHENGTLKAIGASAEDQTGQIIQDLTKTALSVWSAAGAVPAAGREPASIAGEPQFVDCKADTRAKLAELNTIASRLETNGKKAEEIKKLTEAMASRASLKLLTLADRQKLSAKFAELDQLDADIRADGKLLAKNKKALGVESKTSWKGDYAQAYNAQALPLSVPGEDLVRMANLFELKPIEPSAPQPKEPLPKQCFGEEAALDTCVTAMTATSSAFATDQPVMRTCAEGSDACFSEPGPKDAVYQSRDAFSDPGIFVRDPVIARLLLCFARTSPVCTMDNDKAGLEPQFTPQLGQLRFIPFKVRAFEGRSFALQMSKEGRLTKLEYSTDKAMLAGIAASAANISGQVEAALDKREERRRKDEEYAHKMSVQKEQDEIDALNRQIALKEATAKLAPDPLEAVKLETAELQAMKALAEAKSARIEAEQKLE